MNWNIVLPTPRKCQETNANPNFANPTPQLLFENRTCFYLVWRDRERNSFGIPDTKNVNLVIISWINLFLPKVGYDWNNPHFCSSLFQPQYLPGKWKPDDNWLQFLCSIFSFHKQNIRTVVLPTTLFTFSYNCLQKLYLCKI